MYLAELYEVLETSELSQHSMFCDGLAPQNYPKVNQIINQGLVALYGRFTLKFSELTLVMSEERTEYLLTKRYAISDSSEGVKYIDDSIYSPFLGNVLKILNVMDEGGCVLPMNDSTSCNGVFTPTTNSLVVSNPSDGDVLFVAYQSGHPNIDKESIALSTEIELPIVLIPALCAYVGHRLYSGSTDATAANKANSFLSQFELLCMQQDTFGFTNRDDGTPNQIFYSGGWV